jgi:hypothetical protein
MVGDPAHPYCFIEVSEGCFGVGFLDEHKREPLRYLFEDLGDGRVFLSEATHREYVAESDEVAKGTVYRFSKDARVQIERVQKPFQQATVTDGHTDVSRNWEPKPAFGD